MIAYDAAYLIVGIFRICIIQFALSGRDLLASQNGGEGQERIMHLDQCNSTTIFRWVVGYRSGCVPGRQLPVGGRVLLRTSEERLKGGIGIGGIDWG